MISFLLQFQAQAQQQPLYPLSQHRLDFQQPENANYIMILATCRLDIQPQTIHVLYLF